MTDSIEVTVARIDERTKSIEKRLARVEIGLLTVLVASAWVTIQYVLSAVGLPA